MEKKKKLYIGIIVIGVVLLIGLVGGALYLKSVSDYKRKVQETSFENIRISDVPDGTYVGEYDVDFVSAKVEVTVSQGRITDIQILEHENGRGSTAEGITDTIIEEQRVDVDAVSGATSSSTVLKKAVENALLEGMRQ